MSQKEIMKEQEIIDKEENTRGKYWGNVKEN